jgi:peroxiredoxin
MTESATIPRVGDPAPDFTLQGIGGREWSLAGERGQRNVVLLFYVLDWTPG